MTKTNRLNKLACAASAAAAMCIANAAHAQVLLSYFNFNTPSASGSTFPNTGGAESYDPATHLMTTGSEGVFASDSSFDFTGIGNNVAGGGNPAFTNFGGSTVNATSGTAAGQALAVVGQNNNGGSFIFKSKSLGYADLSITYASQRTGTGFTSQAWSYSIDNGATFVPASTITSIPSGFGLQTVNFAAIDAVENLSSVLFKVTFNGNTSVSGNNRIDNFRLSGLATGIVDPALALTFNGTGTWDSTTNGQWKNGATNTVWSDNNNAIFGGVGGPTVTMDADKIASKVTFTGATTYTLAANSTSYGLHIFGGPTNGGGIGIDAQSSATISSTLELLTTTNPTVSLNVASGKTLTVSGQVFGSATLDKSGTGTLVLSALNNAQLVTQVSAGTLQISDNAQLGGGMLSMLGGTLQVTAPIDIARTFSTVGSFSIDTGSNDVTISGDASGSLAGGGTLTKVGSGALILSTASIGLNHFTGTVNVGEGSVKLTAVGTSFPDSALGQGTANINSGGTLEFSGVAVGSPSLSTGVRINLNGGGTLKATGTSAYGKLDDTNGFNIANDAGTVTVNAPLATDKMTFRSPIRMLIGYDPTSHPNTDGGTTILVNGLGTVTLNSGKVNGATTAFAGSWLVSNGILNLAAAEVGNKALNGEPLNALGFRGGVRTNAVPVTLTGGVLAVGVDAVNPQLTTPSTDQLPYLVNPITLSGGALASTGTEIDSAGADTGVAVAAKFGGALTISGTGSKILTYNPLAASTSEARTVNIMAGGATTWSGALTVDGGTSTGGVATFNRDAGAVSTVVDGASLQVGTGNSGTLATALFKGAPVTTDAAQHSVAVSVLSGGKIALDPALPQALKVKTLAISGTGTVDVSSRFLVIDQGSLTTATAQVKAAKGAKVTGSGNGAGVLHNGQYNYVGTGIGSSAVLAGNTTAGFDKYALGVVKNSDLSSPFTSFNGVTVATDAILVRYTYNGDANLDGKIDSADYAAINAGFASPTQAAKGWVAGDFTLDGIVNADDYAIIDFGILNGGGTLIDGAAAPVVVPEPTSLSLIALGGAALMGRRRRNA